MGGKTSPWDEIDPLLGTDTDERIGKAYTVHMCTIQRRRVSLAIPPFVQQNTIPWDVIEDELGKASDKNIARKYGCDNSMISDRRNALGIPVFMPEKMPNPDFDWSKVDWGMTNRALAKLFESDGIGSAKYISKVRKKKNAYPTAYKNRKTGIPEAALMELGAVLDTQVAKNHGVSRSTARLWRVMNGIPSIVKRLTDKEEEEASSVIADTSIPSATAAEMVGMDVSCVEYRRRIRGIVAKRGERRKYNWSLAEPYWGKVSNSEISRITGIPRVAIGRRIHRLGLPRYQRKGEDTE